ncbi:MAG: hypothetical protein ACYSUD_10050, partial [Planctomycetota bacterium]
MNRHIIGDVKLRVLSCWLVLFLIALPCIGAQQAGWKAGVASAAITPDESMWMAGAITPDESMWMAGYAARKGPSEGKVHDLWAKVLAMEDAKGTRFVIVTVDLIGIPRSMRDWLEKQVNKRYKLPPEALLLNASHTHCGPVVR